MLLYFFRTEAVRCRTFGEDTVQNKLTQKMSFFEQ